MLFTMYLNLLLRVEARHGHGSQYVLQHFQLPIIKK